MMTRVVAPRKRAARGLSQRVVSIAGVATPTAEDAMRERIGIVTEEQRPQAESPRQRVVTISLRQATRIPTGESVG